MCSGRYNHALHCIAHLAVAEHGAIHARQQAVNDLMRGGGVDHVLADVLQDAVELRKQLRAKSRVTADTVMEHPLASHSYCVHAHGCLRSRPPRALP